MLHDYIVGLASRALEVFPTEGKIAAVSGKLAAERDALPSTSRNAPGSTATCYQIEHAHGPLFETDPQKLLLEGASEF